MTRKTLGIGFSALLPILSFGNDFFHAIPLDDFPEIYAIIQRDNLAQIVATSGSGVVSNVFPIYIAGYVHSELAIPALLDRIDWPGLNEPESRYYRPPNPAAPRLGLVTLFPRPPTPATAALTQMPVSWQALRNRLENAPAASRRAELLAWVSAVRHPSEFFDWMEHSYAQDTNRWSSLSTYATTNLVGRKPFCMSNYGGCPDFDLNESLQLYNNCVRELRCRAATANVQNDTQGISSISNVLHILRQPLVELTYEGLCQTIELVPKEGDYDGLSETEEVFLDE